MPYFLFTDIEGSTKLWESFPQAMPDVIRRHDAIIKEELARHGGRIIDHMGDGVYAVFDDDCRPLLCVLTIQIRFNRERWSEIGGLRVRMGLNARTADRVGIDYFKEKNDFFGPVVNHTSRLMNVAWGGQILFTEEVLTNDEVPAGATAIDLGRHILRNLTEPQQIFSLEHPDMLRRDFPPLRTLASRANNLPSPSTIFIGRERELTEIARLLADPRCRLLNLTGPGGIGKTRLALAAATEQLEDAREDNRFANGIYFISLASLVSTDHIAPAIAEALQFSFYENSPPKKQLQDYLHHKKMLLILDNFEHLVQGADLLSDLLAGAPGLTLLVTSRERLNLQSEWTISVSGMQYPQTDTAALRENVESYTAVQLFLNSARRLNPAFSTTPEEQRTIAQICRLLDGLPLGIELAATWTRVLDCREIAAEIHNNLNFLSSNLRDLPERHHSLEAVFNHSWQLLTSREQVILEKLSVFCGDFSRDAAKSVTFATLGELIALMDKSMVRVNDFGRYEIHMTIRQFLAQKLAADEAHQEAATAAHSSYFGSIAEKQKNRLRGPAQKSALFEMAREIENIRVGWQTALSTQDDNLIKSYMDSLYNFFWIRGWTQEGANTFRDAVSAVTGALTGPVGLLKREQKETAVLLGRIMARQGAFCYRLGLADQSRRLLQESLNTFQKYNLISDMGYVFTYLGATAYLEGDNDAADQLLQQSLQYAQMTRSILGATLAYHHLGLVAMARQNYDEAQDYFQKSLDLSETLGEPFGMAMALNNLGIVAYNLGQYEAALELQRRSLAMRREINDQWGIATTLNSMALVAYSQKKHERARQYLLESLNLYREVGDKRRTAVTLKDLSVVALAQDKPEEAELLRKESLETFPSSGQQANFTTISSNDT